jgi:hypothetical protein
MVLAVPAFVGLAAQGALAQSHPAARGRAATHGAGKKGPLSAADAGVSASLATTALTAAPGVAPTAGATIPSDAGASVIESKTLDGGTKVFKFSELDIEGRLKSPQLVYFLRRVRAEFSAGDLGHRTFMREMSETRKESSF